MARTERMDRECLVCSAKTPTAGFLFCKSHWKEYKDRLKEDWFRGIKNLTAVQARSDKLMEDLLSIDWLEESREDADV